MPAVIDRRYNEHAIVQTGSRVCNRLVDFSPANVDFHAGNARFPEGNDHFPVGNVDFHGRDVRFQPGNARFHAANGHFPLGNARFHRGNAHFPLADDDFSNLNDRLRMKNGLDSRQCPRFCVSGRFQVFVSGCFVMTPRRSLGRKNR